MPMTAKTIPFAASRKNALALRGKRRQPVVN
jgi:hypothetical protein